MGTLVGHVLPGMGFVLVGLWHLINHIRLHVASPSAYVAPAWFPTKAWRHGELYMIMVGSVASVAMELFIGPTNHQPFDPLDGTIPANHLHNFEHASISLGFFVFALLAILLDRTKMASQQQQALTQLLGAAAFGQQLLLFHLHSADHNGPEGQYHALLQLIVLVSFLATLMGLGFPQSFHISFVRSLSIFFQGVWLVVMGFALWTPSLIAKGCFMHAEEGHHVVRCTGDESLHRAKSLVNLQFSWLFIGTSIFGVCLYMALHKVHGQHGHDLNKVKYFSLGIKEEDQDQDQDQDHDDVESLRGLSKTMSGESETKSFTNDMGKLGFVGHVNMER